QPAGGGQQIHVAGTQVLLGGPAGQYQGQAAGTGDQARPEKGLQLVGASVPQLGEQRQKHAGGQGDEEDPENETDDAQDRKSVEERRGGTGGSLLRAPMAARPERLGAT